MYPLPFFQEDREKKSCSPASTVWNRIALLNCNSLDKNLARYPIFWDQFQSKPPVTSVSDWQKLFEMGFSPPIFSLLLPASSAFPQVCNKILRSVTSAQTAIFHCHYHGGPGKSSQHSNYKGVVTAMSLQALAGYRKLTFQIQNRVDVLSLTVPIQLVTDISRKNVLLLNSFFFPSPFVIVLHTLQP